MVPVREFMLVFAVIEYATVPLPVPLEPLVMLIQLALVVADHGHGLAVVTLTLPLLAVLLNEALVPESAYVQTTPDWLTVNVCPPIVMAPLREFVVEFAATAYETVPLPVPVAPLVMLIQLALVVADHEH